MSSCFFFIITCRRYCFWNPIACTFFITVRHAVDVLFNIFWTIFMQSQFSGLSDRARENTSNVINRIFSGFSGRARKHSCDCLEIFITCLEIFITGLMFTKSPWMVHLMMLVHLPGLIAECCPREIFSWGNKSSYKLYSPHNHATNCLLPY